VRFFAALLFFTFFIRVVKKIANLFISKPKSDNAKHQSNNIKSDNIIDAEFEDVN